MASTIPANLRSSRKFSEPPGVRTSFLPCAVRPWLLAIAYWLFRLRLCRAGFFVVAFFCIVPA
jgi:hypothetical protein